MIEFICATCSFNESKALEYLQKRQRITDPLALSVVMANIKQESNFTPNICEGGARVPYEDCHRGGYGLIQWTTLSRYNGLGNFCKKYGLDPSTFEGQLRYMSNENQFQQALLTWQIPGQSYTAYHNAAYRWLGWGIEGPRKTYTYNYLDRLQKVSVNEIKVQSTSSNQRRVGYIETLLGFVGIKV